MFLPNPRVPPLTTRRWRPPASGHTVSRYGELEMHPFSAAPVAGSPSIFDEIGPSTHPQRATVHDKGSAPMRNRPVRVMSPSQRALHAASGNAVLVSPHRAETQTLDSSRPRSASVPRDMRSPLDGVGEGNCPISPEDSTTRGTMQTVDIIEQFPAPPQRGSSEENERAMENRMAGLFLFPRPDERGTSEAHETGRHAAGNRANNDLVTGSAEATPANTVALTLVDSTSAQPSARTNKTATITPEDEAEDILLIRGSLSRPSIRGENSTRYRHSYTPIYDNDAASLRSFDQRQSPTEHPPLNISHISRLPSRNGVVSARSGNSRYFSATSTAIGTRAVAQCRLLAPEQEARALANGALRFSSMVRRDSGFERGRSVSVLPDSSPSTVDENDTPSFPISPVTITEASKTYCPHRIAQLRVKEYRRNQHQRRAPTAPQRATHAPTAECNFDGTSPTRLHRQEHSTDSPPSPHTVPIAPAQVTPPTPPTPPSPMKQNPLRRLASRLNKPLPPLPLSTAPTEPMFPSEPSRQTYPPIQFTPQLNNSPPTRAARPSFAAANHIRNYRQHHRYHRGTWRTRMKRTKCWRCELESRRTRSAEAMSRAKRKLLCNGEAWGGWWDRWKERIEWTCFCRYRGYEDNSEDEEGCDEGVRMSEERVRLGRFGGMLTRG